MSVVGQPQLPPARLIDETCSLLIDFDNFVPPGQSALTPELFTYELLALVRRIRQSPPRPTYFDIRLYGGWHSDSALTVRGSEVAQLVASARLFPLTDSDRAIVRGDVTLVDRLLAVPGAPLASTYRRRSGLPRLRLSSRGHPVECADPGNNCPMRILHRLAIKKDGSCPQVACAVSTSDAFVVHEQKMVDTLLACDLIEATRRQPARVVVVTSDSDFVPPLLQAAAIRSERVLVIGDQELWDEEHVQTLLRAGIAIAYRGDAV